MANPGIACTRCGSDMAVNDTRKHEGRVKRRRECPVCGMRCTTHEIVVEGSWAAVRQPLEAWRVAAGDVVVGWFESIGGEG